MNKINVITIFLFASLVFIVAEMKAQSGLNFSQVIMLNNNSQTVPTGKVWKVESIMSGLAYPIGSNCTSPTNNGNYGTAFFIDNNIYFTDVAYNAGTNYSSIMFTGSRALPMWLSAGTSIKTACSTSIATVIEFDIVP